MSVEHVDILRTKSLDYNIPNHIPHLDYNILIYDDKNILHEQKRPGSFCVTDSYEYDAIFLKNNDSRRDFLEN